MLTGVSARGNVPTTKYDQGWPGWLAAGRAVCPLLVRFRSRSRSFPCLPATGADSSLTRVSPFPPPSRRRNSKVPAARAAIREFLREFLRGGLEREARTNPAEGGEPWRWPRSLVAPPFRDLQPLLARKEEGKGKAGKKLRPNCVLRPCYANANEGRRR